MCIRHLMGDNLNVVLIDLFYDLLLDTWFLHDDFDAISFSLQTLPQALKNLLIDKAPD